MLVEQQQDLRKFHDAWRMSVYECVEHKNKVAIRTGQWEVVLGRSNPDYVVSAKHSNAKYAFEDALAMAKTLQEKYGESPKNNS